jgi:signal peptidase I
VSAAVLTVCALLVLHVWGVEPFEVPTGSMAPALVGHHRCCSCPRCGFTVTVGRHRSDKDGCGGEACYRAACCPNCGCDELGLGNVPEALGDRLLVNKSVFALRRPRRWEMVVFRLFDKIFVKRIIGLPGEWLLILGGDLYIDGQLERKSLAQCKALAVCVFDGNYLPGPDGWRPRWEVLAPGVQQAAEHPLVDGRLCLNLHPEAIPYQGVVYRNLSLDERKCQPILDECSYNGGTPAGSETVHDFLLSCDVEVVQGTGGLVFALNDGQDEVFTELPVARPGAAECWTARHQPRSAFRTGLSREALRRAAVAPLQPGRRYRVEYAFVDRRVTMTLDGVPVFAPVDLSAPVARAAVERPAFIGGQGVQAVIENIQLYRDIHYSQAGRNAVSGQPVRLQANQYFVLGDNSPNSEDSRFWPEHGAVPAGNLLGKPFLVHLPSRVVAWTGFGRHWQSQVPDWSRLRWLR